MAIEVNKGVLRIPEGAQLPAKARLAVIILDDNEGADVHLVADAGGAFDFLREEPDIYSDADILPERRNPRFGSRE